MQNSEQTSSASFYLQGCHFCSRRTYNVPKLAHAFQQLYI